MREAVILGSVTSTVKHPSMNGKKLLLVQVVDAAGNPEGKPEVVVDCIGAGKGDRIILSWDGIYMTEIYNDPQVPQRAWVGGIIDSVSGRHERSDGDS